jgi:hypothetical protein
MAQTEVVLSKLEICATTQMAQVHNKSETCAITPMAQARNKLEIFVTTPMAQAANVSEINCIAIKLPNPAVERDCAKARSPSLLR